MQGAWVDESILAHSNYGTLVKIQGLINGGWTGRTIYLQFHQGHRQQSNCFHGNPGDSGTPSRQNGFPWISDCKPGTQHGLSRVAATQQLHQCLIPCLFARRHPGCSHLGLDTGDTRRKAHTHRQPPQHGNCGRLRSTRSLTRLCRWAAGRLKQPATDGTACHPETCPATMPVSGEAGKAVTVRALTGTTDETRTRPRAAVLEVSVHTRHGPLGHQATLAGVHVSPGWVSAPIGRRW